MKIRPKKVQVQVVLETNFKSLQWFGGLGAQFGMVGECQIRSFLETGTVIKHVISVVTGYLEIQRYFID